MAQLVQADLISEVRRALDQITLSGEVVTTDTDVEDLASSNFSDNDITERLLNAVKYIAARCRAVYLPDLIIAADPTASWPEAQILRVLGSRHDIGGKVPTRRTFSSDRYYQDAGRAAGTDYPIWIYEDCELFLRDSGAFSTAATVGDTLADLTPTIYYVKEPTAVTDLEDRFEAAVIQHTLSDCFGTLQEIEMAADARREFFNEINPYLRPMFKDEVSQNLFDRLQQ